MAYNKPMVLAQNGKQRSFAAGCPMKDFLCAGNVKEGLN